MKIIILIIIIIPILASNIWKKISCSYRAPYVESQPPYKPLCTNKNQNCRIVNLKGLYDSGNNGKVILLNIYNKRHNEYHLITCDKNNIVIDQNHWIKEGSQCNENNLTLNSKLSGYDLLGSIVIIDGNIATTKYNGSIFDWFIYYWSGIRYVKIFLHELKKD